ncbi:MAG: hypothetical protein HC898_12180 [Phycisphaerales bacterium]|nr:hypothetical protein [Phycisphaerales bacterium]
MGEEAEERAIYWLDAVVIQGGRLAGSEHHHFDAHFFAIALFKAASWLQKLPKAPGETSADPIGLFIKHFLTEARAIRNMLEHEEDYRSGKGRCQSEYIRTVKLNKGRLSATLPPFTIVHSDEGLSLAGRISVVSAVHESKSILAALRVRNTQVSRSSSE